MNMQDPILTERDLEDIFSGRKRPKAITPLVQGIIFVVSFLVVSGLVFVVMNATSLRQNFLFWYNYEYKIAPVSPEVQSLATASSGTGSVSLPVIDDNTLNLPVINVKAPISWEVPNNPTPVADGLSRGLIQIKGTALPGERGNVFITGHSSNYPWAKGSYNNIFALLNKVVVGDMVEVNYQNIQYLYKIKEIKVVEPTDTSVMNSKNESILTLMTCTPVGTSLRRLIVIANQVYPNPAANTTFNSQGVGPGLPKVH